MVRLIQWNTDYAERLAKIANNVNIANNLTYAFPHPYTIDNARQFISMTLSHQTIQIFVIEYNGALVGAMGLRLKILFKKAIWYTMN